MNTLPPIPNEPLRNRWYYANSKNQPQGPLSLDELQRLAESGEIKPETQVFEEGGTEWTKYSEVARLLPPPIPTTPQFPLSQVSLPPLPAEAPIMEAKGYCGTLQLFPDKIRIKRKGIGAFFAYGLKGDKDIFIAQLSSVQFKAAGVTSGYIQFAFSGCLEAKRGIWQATGDENTVMFHTPEQPAFERIKAEIDKRLAAKTSKEPKGNTDSYLEELEKLATLRDRGIVTPEEFDAKKRQLLGI